MTMLQLFEDEASKTRVRDVPCAACASAGRTIAGDVCPWCKGAGWLVLGDHDWPCAACNNPRRQDRPVPPGRWWLETTS